MTCLRAEVDNMDSYRSLVSTLWCVVCRPTQYKTRILCNHDQLHCVQCSSKKLMLDQHSMVAGQVTLWSDKVQAVVK